MLHNQSNMCTCVFHQLCLNDNNNWYHLSRSYVVYAAVIDLMATDGVINVHHLPLVASGGFASDLQLVDAYRKRIAYYQLTPEEKKARWEVYAASRSARASNLPCISLPKGLPLGPLRGALKGLGPTGWRCDDGALGFLTPTVFRLLSML